MEIHSSSLYIAPAGTPPKNSGGPQPSQQSLEQPAAAAKPAVSSDAEFAEAAAKKQGQQLALIAPVGDSDDNNTPLNSRHAKALNTYAATYNQFQQQSSISLTGIDLYA